MSCEIVDPPVSAIEAQTGLMQPGMAVSNEYELKSGVCILPVAESAPCNPNELAEWSPVVVLRLHSPYRIRKARFDVKKSTTPPILPAVGDTGAFVWIGGTINFGPPSVNAGLVSSDWSVSAEYVYVEDCVSRTIDGFVLGTPSYILDSQRSNLANTGGAGTPPFGAIAQAGTDAKVGWTLSQSINPSSTLWSYTCQSYYPGKFFNDYLPNGSQS